MTTEMSSTAGTEKRSPWLTIAKYLFIALLVVLFYLLGLSMAQHRFFRGGRIDQRGVLTE